MSNTNNINIAVEIKPELENVYLVYGCFSYYYQGVILSKAIEKLQSRANKNVLFQNSNQTKSNILNLWLPGKSLTSLFVAYEGPFFHWFFQTWLSSIFGLWKSRVFILIFYFFFIWKCWFFVFVWFLYSDQGGDALTFFICLPTRLLTAYYSLETQSDSS